MTANGDKYSAAILAGGNNTRFNGINKALLEYNGEKFIKKISDTLAHVFDEIFVISNISDELEKNINYPVFEDKIKSCGPLSGIHAALFYSKKDFVFVVSCDMPFISKDIIEKQIDYFSKFSSDVCIPKSKEYIEPLHAIYSKKILHQLENFLLTSDNFKIMNFLKNTDICYWDIDCLKNAKESFININTPEEFNKYLKGV